MVLRSDSEPGMISFKTELVKQLTAKHGQEIVPEDALADKTTSASNGLAEHVVKEVKAKVCILKCAADHFSGFKIPAAHAALSWLPGFSAMTMNI